MSTGCVATFCSTTKPTRELGSSDIEAFLTHLAVNRNVSASTQAQAKSALLFLYREVLAIELPWLDRIVSAKVPQRLPVVLTQDEVVRLLGGNTYFPRHESRKTAARENCGVITQTGR